MYTVGGILFWADDNEATRAAFAAARDAAEAFRPQGLAHQFYGRAVDTPRPFHWYLVWAPNSAADVDAVLSGLVERVAPIAAKHRSFSCPMRDSPLPALRSPIVVSVAWRVAAEDAERSRVAMDRALVAELQLAPPGLISASLSSTSLRHGLYLAGWTTVEAHIEDLMVQSERGEMFRRLSEAAYALYEGMDFYHVELAEHVRTA